MSHQIRMVFIDKDLYTSTCNDLQNSLNDMSDKLKDISNNNINIQNLQSELNKIKEFISTNNSINEIEFMDFQRQLSTLEKNVANTRLMTKDLLTQDLINYLQSKEQQELNLYDEIKSHGVLAIEVFEHLYANGISKTKDNFQKYISIVEKEQLNREKISKYIQNSFDLIDESNLNTDLKFNLKKQIRNIKDIKELKDVNAIIQSKINESNRVKEFALKLTKLLGNQNFTIQKNSNSWSFDDNDNVVLKMSMKNKNNNIVQMIITSNNEIKYKLGNYVGHACEKTTEKLINDLKSKGVIISNIVVKRDFERPQSMKMEIKNEGGEK